MFMPMFFLRTRRLNFKKSSLSVLFLCGLNFSCLFESPSKNGSDQVNIVKSEIRWSYNLELGNQRVVGLDTDTTVAQWEKSDTVTGRIEVNFDTLIIDSLFIRAANQVRVPVDDSGYFSYVGTSLFGFTDGNYQIRITPRIKTRYIERYILNPVALTINVFYVGTSIPYISISWPEYTISTRKPIINVWAELLGYAVEFIDTGAVGFRFLSASNCVDTFSFIAAPFLKFDSISGSRFIHRWISDSGQIPSQQGRICLQVRMGAKSLPSYGVNWENYVSKMTSVTYDTIPPTITISVPASPYNPDSIRSWVLGFSLSEESSVYWPQILDSSETNVLYDFGPRKNIVNTAIGLPWNGLTTNGDTLPTGSYILRVKSLDYAVHSRGQRDTIYALMGTSTKFDSIWYEIEKPVGEFIPGINGSIARRQFSIIRN